MNKKFKNSKIVEALAEFYFEPNEEADLTVPGLLYSKIQKEFPIKKEQPSVMIDFVPDNTGMKQQVKTSTRMQFFNKEETALLQIDANLLTINKLKPYSSWQEFSKMISNNFNLYIEFARPSTLNRLGLRYINKFDFELKNFKLKDYFNFIYDLPEDLSKTTKAFQVRVEIPYKNDVLIITLSNTKPTKEGNISIILDLYYMNTNKGEIKINTIMNWINNAHNNLENVFLKAITEKTKISLDKE